jgi:hypothetical protein
VSLFWKILVAFMIAMTITSVGAIYVDLMDREPVIPQSDFEGRLKSSARFAALAAAASAS